MEYESNMVDGFKKTIVIMNLLKEAKNRKRDPSIHDFLS